MAKCLTDGRLSLEDSLPFDGNIIIFESAMGQLDSPRSWIIIATMQDGLSEIFLLDLGRKDYRTTWELQRRIHERRVKNEIADTLIFVEHPPVVTLGKSGKEKNIVVSERLLAERGIELFRVERGGDVTFHGPGQLVGYPVFNIRTGLVGVRKFIRKIETAVVACLDEFRLRAFQKDKLVGVWTETGKICSIGIAVKQWVSFHGFALNVNNDLTQFDIIVPCGIPGIKMTSMAAALGKDQTMARVKETLAGDFAEVFEKRTVPVCLADVI